MKNIILTGFMASGKTTVGKYIAKKYGMNFLDTDEMIAKQEEKTISEIFESFGEKYFRELENKAAINLKNSENTVIATGGGFVLNPQNIELLRINGVIVNLKTAPEIIIARMQNAREGRPLMTEAAEEEIIERFNQRKIYYNNYDICIKLTEELTVEECAEMVMNGFNEFINQQGGIGI